MYDHYRCMIFDNNSWHKKPDSGEFRTEFWPEILYKAFLENSSDLDSC